MDNYNVTTLQPEPHRPKHIPAAAMWVPDQGAWELGPIDVIGNRTGTWQYWQAPTGYRCCSIEYTGPDNNTFNFVRYHPDGAVARTGCYRNGAPFGEIVWYRCHVPTRETFPTRASDSAWKVVSTLTDGVIVRESYYDSEGNECQPPFFQWEDVDAIMAPVWKLFRSRAWYDVLEATRELVMNPPCDSYTGSENFSRMIAWMIQGLAIYELSGREVTSELEVISSSIIYNQDFEIWYYDPHFNDVKAALMFAWFVQARLAQRHGDVLRIQRCLNQLMEFNVCVNTPWDESLYHPLMFHYEMAAQQNGISVKRSVS